MLQSQTKPQSGVAATKAFSNRQQGTFARSLIKLFGHIAGVAALFVGFFVIVWLVSVALNYLNSVHGFPDDIFAIIVRIELWLIYADCVVCSVVLAAVTWTFIRDELGAQR